MHNKLLFQIWLTELQRRFLQHPPYAHITINGVHPGYVASGIWNLNSNAPWFEWVLKTAAWILGISSEQGSFAITHAATSVEAGKSGGRYFNRVWEEEAMPHCRDRDCGVRVWRKVDEELGLRGKGLLDVLGWGA